MADIEKIIDGINIPKQILDKSETILKTLFGPSFNELGGMIGDQVKLRRFNNQIEIFSKAQQSLKENNIDPKKISLKVLAPLIEYSSLEEEESLQEKWANLTVHILGSSEEAIFQQNCIGVLNKISSKEAMLLDNLHTALRQRKKERFDRINKNQNPYYKVENEDDQVLENFIFDVNEVLKEFNHSYPEVEYMLSSLISLGLLKWETDVKVSAEKSYDDPEDKNIDVDVMVINNDNFIFTSMGDRFVKVCSKLS